MSECPNYKEHRRVTESKEISINSPPSIVVTIPYCTHSDSPAPFEEATRVIGRMLQCQGIFARCQLPGGYRTDD